MRRGRTGATLRDSLLCRACRLESARDLCGGCVAEPCGEFVNADAVVSRLPRKRIEGSLQNPIEDGER